MSDHTAKLVPVLDGSNYNAWYKAMKAYLMAHSLWGYANGDITRPATDDEDWVKQNSVAIGNMVLRVKESIQQDVIDLDTAEEVWIRLKDSYGTPTSTSIYKDFKEALSLRINPNSHPGPQIDKMSAAFQHLSAAKMIIPNQVQAMILLAALPPKWDLIVSIVTTANDLDDLEFSNARDAILSQYDADSTRGKGKPHHANKLSTVKRKRGDPNFSNQQRGNQQQSSNNDQQQQQQHRQCGRHGGKGKKKQDHGHSHIADIVSLPPPTSSTVISYGPSEAKK